MIIAVTAPGAMGSALGRVMHEHGARVLTSLQGRGGASRDRAAAAGLVAVDDRDFAEADVILSIVPPAQAVAVAERFAGVLAGQPGGRRPVFVDCNAVDVATVHRVAAVAAGAGLPFVDGCLIGLPPEPGQPSPKLYCSGAPAGELAPLAGLGIDVRVLDGPVGAASALKMSYAGITKGLTALAAAMILAATRAGAADALRRELADSQAQLLARFAKALPDMYPKAYRWAGEMEEIAAFLHEDPAAASMFKGAAGVYERLAGDGGSDRGEVAALDAFYADGA